MSFIVSGKQGTLNAGGLAHLVGSLTRAEKIRPQSVMWFLKSMQKISHYWDLLILSALVHFCISFPIWVFSHGKLECLLQMVTPAPWCHCPQLPWWIPLIGEVSELFENYWLSVSKESLFPRKASLIIMLSPVHLLVSPEIFPLR